MKNCSSPLEKAKQVQMRSLPMQALCAGRELHVGPFSGSGAALALPGSPPRGAGAAPSPSPMGALDFEPARGWWNRFPPLRRLRQLREEDPRGK